MQIGETTNYATRSISFDTFKNTPGEYQHYVIRIMSMQAYAERLGAMEMGYQLKLTPNHRACKALARIVSDEATHAYLLYSILEKIGVSEDRAIAIATGKENNSNPSQSLQGAIDVGNEDNEWLDLILNNMLMDRAGSFMVDNFSKCSFAPWAEACEKIYHDEQWHKQFGLKQFELVLEQFDHKLLAIKFSNWFVRALNFFGPPSINTQKKLYFYGIKHKSNQTLREEFAREVKSLLQAKKLEHLLLQIDYDYPCRVVMKGVSE